MYHNPPYKVKCPPPDKYKEKWEVIDGVLVIGDKKVTGNFGKEEKNEDDEPKKYDAKATWLAKLARMRKVKPDDQKEEIDDNDSPFVLDTFGDTHETRKLLEHPDIKFALGEKSLLKRYVRADRAPPNYLTINKKNIKSLEASVKLINHAGTL